MLFINEKKILKIFSLEQLKEIYLNAKNENIRNTSLDRIHMIALDFKESLEYPKSIRENNNYKGDTINLLSELCDLRSFDVILICLGNLLTRENALDALNMLNEKYKVKDIENILHFDFNFNDDGNVCDERITKAFLKYLHIMYQNEPFKFDREDAALIKYLGKCEVKEFSPLLVSIFSNIGFFKDTEWGKSSVFEACILAMNNLVPVNAIFPLLKHIGNKHYDTDIIKTLTLILQKSIDLVKDNELEVLSGSKDVIHVYSSGGPSEYDEYTSSVRGYNSIHSDTYSMEQIRILAANELKKRNKLIL